VDTQLGGRSFILQGCHIGHMEHLSERFGFAPCARTVDAAGKVCDQMIGKRNRPVSDERSVAKLYGAGWAKKPWHLLNSRGVSPAHGQMPH